MHRLFSIRLILIIIVFCCAGFVFGGEFETVLEKAEKGNSSAQNYLGLMYAKGQGTSQDYNKAIHWFKKAAEQGQPSAHNSIGLFYYKGKGVSVNLIRQFIGSKKHLSWDMRVHSIILE